MNITIEKKAFESNYADRGFTCTAHYLSEPKGDALVEIFRDGQPYRRFLYPDYRVWNIAAHFGDIVTGEIEGDYSGYDLAGWTVFSVVPIRELEAEEGERE